MVRVSKMTPLLFRPAKVAMKYLKITQPFALLVAISFGGACSSGQGDGLLYDDRYPSPYDQQGVGGYGGGSLFNDGRPEVISRNPYDGDFYHDEPYYDDRPYSGDPYADPGYGDGYYNDGYYNDPYNQSGYPPNDRNPQGPYYDDRSAPQPYSESPPVNGRGGPAQGGPAQGGQSPRPPGNGSSTVAPSPQGRSPIVGVGIGPSGLPAPIPSQGAGYGNAPNPNHARVGPDVSAGAGPTAGPPGGGYSTGPYRSGSPGGPPGNLSCLAGGEGPRDYGAPGPYSVGSHVVHIAPYGSYTLYYPEPLEANCLHPIVAWGNDTATPGPEAYGLQNEHAASWGLVVAAAHTAHLDGGAHHAAALDYLLAFNDDPRSPFYGRLNPRAGTAGHGHGSEAANIGARHPRVQAVVNVQGTESQPPGDTAFLCLTSESDPHADACHTAVDSTGAPAMLANFAPRSSYGHNPLEAFFADDGSAQAYMRLSTAWFRCFLADDYNACGLFQWGDNCPACQEADWARAYVRNF